MIKINGIPYDLVNYEDCTVSGVRNLSIVIKGEFKTNENNLTIRHNSEVIYGIKILPHYDQEKKTTMFLVYVK